METTLSTNQAIRARPIAQKARLRQSSKNILVVDTAAAKTPTVTSASMIGPRIDLFLIGGASIIVCLLYWMFVSSDNSVTLYNVTWLAFYLSFVVNYPHFASSYQLLYGDYRHLIFKKMSFFWAALIAPALLISLMFVAIQSANKQILSFMVQGMYLSVGWHYVKQIYGTSIVASAIQKRYFGKWEKVFILLNLNSVWALSWVQANIGSDKINFEGISYYTLGLPDYALTIAYGAVAATFSVTLLIMVRKYIQTGVRPATSSLICFASIYCWYLPLLNHPMFFYFIPFFHSMQYLLFVVALKRNQAEQATSQAVTGVAKRSLFMKKFCGFFALAAILGALAFEFIPRSLDSSVPIGLAMLTPTIWYFSFNIFLNLHHYFIDNVIWRGDNEVLKTCLVHLSQNRATT